MEAIKVSTLQKYHKGHIIWFKDLLKQTLAMDIYPSLLVRPTNAKAGGVGGATASFRSVPKHKRKVQHREISNQGDDSPQETP